MSVFHEEKPFLKTDLAFAVWDKHPLAPGHCLIVPTREVKDAFDLKMDELEEIFYLMGAAWDTVRPQFNADGYRIMCNFGWGQHVKHVHFHLIPTYKNRRIPAYDEP